MTPKPKTLPLIAAAAIGTLLLADIASADRGGPGRDHSSRKAGHFEGDRGLGRLAEFDLDGDGVLDTDERAAADAAAAEAEAAREAARAEAEAARAALLAAIDSDGDGEITKEEYDAYKATLAQARFDEADTDASGDISIDELAAASGLEGERLDAVFAHLAGDDGLIMIGEFYSRRGHRTVKPDFHDHGRAHRGKGKRDEADDDAEDDGTDEPTDGTDEPTDGTVGGEGL
jgi:hypothetical protein